jgi:hypothetical protein
MLKMRTTQTFELLGVALIVVAVLATAAYFLRAAPVPLPSIPAEKSVEQVAAPASASVNPVPAHSVYVSEQTLRHMLDDAYEHSWGPRQQELLRTLNARYEHRCCGLPR